MVGHLASPKPLHMARWGGKGALMGCTKRTTGPTGTLPLPTADQTHTLLVVTISFAALQACSSCGFISMMHFCFSFLLLSILRQSFIPPRRRYARPSPLLVVASSPFCPASSNPPLAFYCQAKLLRVQQVDCCIVSAFLIAPAPLPPRQIVASPTLLLPLCFLFLTVFRTLNPVHCRHDGPTDSPLFPEGLSQPINQLLVLGK